MYKNGTKTKKLTKREVFKIYTSLKSVKKDSVKFNISVETINNIREKKTWHWYTNQIDEQLLRLI